VAVKHVLCPPCSGTGWPGAHKPPIGSDVPPCRLCKGRGFIHPDKEEAFWDCIRDSGRIGQPAPCIGEALSWR
jgi:DnaJ-class molecular chaperone